jgi:hypothetical protein
MDITIDKGPFEAGDLLDRKIKKVEEGLALLKGNSFVWDIKILIMMARFYRDELEKVSKMLDEAGVPEWVEEEGNPVPANAAVYRLKWYLNRRKDIKPSETPSEIRFTSKPAPGTVDMSNLEYK